MSNKSVPWIEEIFENKKFIYTMCKSWNGLSSKLPITEQMLFNNPGGNLFGLTKSAVWAGILKKLISFNI